MTAKHKRSGLRPGFTLAEVLVTVGIVALLAAVSVPAIVGQFEKGDVGRVTNDVANIRTAVEQYLADIRHYPSTLGQLSRAAASTDVDLLGSQIGTFAAGRYKGPYLAKDSAGATKTGNSWTFGGKFIQDTMVYSATKATMAMSLYVLGVDTTTAMHLDSLIDDGVSRSGSVRWRKGSSPGTNDTLKFLLVPIS